ncbi:MAG: TMEM165/GDT1 family protein [Polynucleobacter sp.]|jgi:putative Ca2+/H+ antiporter (TMEM165/GDT1 family)|uniref:TMEM165/GDT1 family protein n=2 Tax=unclassified Polynucleobacter TaxID=2640945 RepID=UPI001C0BC043|nr:TMEM165/GDT1 family protein [Polynucleobacter sp. 31A-FELB]MBU3587304.1 TMEM165/GDT1 family protein [Polynucleobacter sp. 31A-FELB]
MDLSALALSTGVVALAEMGDKTQLLSLMLAARYPKQALAIIGGILIATIANHACAALLGHWLTTFMSPDLLKWILGLSFLGIGLWLLVPDHIDDAAGSKVADKAFQVFILTVGLFFLAEMGDKTQIATIALGAKYSDVFSVTVGTTLGMMLANAPAVWIGQKFTKRMPIKWVHAVAAVTFIAIGIATLIWG